MGHVSEGRCEKARVMVADFKCLKGYLWKGN